jgi:hypothetical protein
MLNQGNTNKKQTNKHKHWLMDECNFFTQPFFTIQMPDNHTDIFRFERMYGNLGKMSKDRSLAV